MDKNCPNAFILNDSQKITTSYHASPSRISNSDSLTAFNPKLIINPDYTQTYNNTVSGKFVPTRRGVSCPVCDDTKGRCRIAGDVVLCMTGVDGLLSPPVGYRYTKPTKNGLWGIYAPDDRQLSEVERQTRQLQRQLQRRARVEAQRARMAKGWDAKTRHQWFTGQLSTLSLNECDRADLVRRGFTDAEIQQSGFMSHDLSKSPTQNGLLIPIRNVDGLIVGGQIRLREATDGGRYRWFELPTDKHLPDTGELPLAVYNRDKLGGIVGLTEGTGHKPFLTSERLNIPVIGAAGGMFASSPKTLKKSLRKLKATEIRLFADAGAVLNTNVMKQYIHLFELLKRWGYTVKVGWWGQVDKSVPDIDELVDLSVVQYISVAEFLAIAAGSLSIINQPSFEGVPIRLIEGGLTWVSGGYGQGKSVYVIPTAIADWRRRYPDSKIILIGSRNGLLAQNGERLGIAPWDERGGTSREAFVCLDSIEKVPLNWLGANPLILIDEADSVIAHGALGGTLGNRYQKVMSYLRLFLNSTLNQAGAVLGLQHDLPVQAKLSAVDMVGDRPNLTIKNIHQPKPITVRITKRNKRQMVVEIKRLLEQGRRVFVVSDSQTFLRQLHRIFGKDYQTLIVDSRSVKPGGDPAARAFQANPDHTINHGHYQLFLGSPSIESGISLTVPHFDAHFAYICGAVEDITALQMLRRDRTCNEVTLYTKQRGVGATKPQYENPAFILHQDARLAKKTRGLSGAEAEILADYAANPDDIYAKQRFEGCVTPSPDGEVFAKIRARYKARINRSKNHLYQNLVDGLRSEGAAVVEDDSLIDDTETEIRQAGKLLRQAKRQLDLDDSAELGAHPGGLSPDAAAVVLSSPKSTWADCQNARKSLLQHRFEGATLDAEQIYRIEKEHGGRVGRGIENHFYALNPEVAAYIDRQTVKSQCEQGFQLYWRYKNALQKANLDRPILERLQPIIDGQQYHSTIRDVKTSTITPCSANIAAAAAAISSSADQFAQLRDLDFSLVTIEPEQWQAMTEAERVEWNRINSQHSEAAIVNKFLTKVLGFKISRKRAGDGARHYLYQIKAEDNPDRVELLESLKLKYSKVFDNPSTVFITSLETMKTVDVVRAWLEDPDGFTLVRDCLTDIFSQNSEHRADAVQILSAVPPQFLAHALAIAP